MISFQIAISNFRSINYQQQPTDSISFKFGSITTTIGLISGSGGKSLFLELTPNQLQQIYSHYACCLFIQKRIVKCFSILSLQRINISDKVICHEISFLNDLRQVKFKCEISLLVKIYKNPKIANTQKLQQRQNALNLMKKAPIPKQTPYTNNFVQNRQDKKIKSFLNNKNMNQTYSVNNDNLQTMKQDLRKQRQTLSNWQKDKNKFVNQPKIMAKTFSNFQQDDEDPFDINPPSMEFTNQQKQERLNVPQIDYLDYGESVEKGTKQKFYNNYQQSPNNTKFATFNRNQNARQISSESPETPSEFQLMKKNSKNLPPKPKNLTKQEIIRMAKLEAQTRQSHKKDNIMIPIAKGTKFELVPLSSLKPQQIIDFVQKQRKVQRQAQQYEQKNKKLLAKEIQMQEKQRKLQQQFQKREKDKVTEKEASSKRRLSKDVRQSVHKQIKQEDNDEDQQQNQQDYLSDFESMSVSNSAIRSRISSRQRNHQEKEEQSIIDDDYSQQFDSYSQSMISKTNRKPKAPLSVSDYSQSYRSNSQSFKK